MLPVSRLPLSELKEGMDMMYLWLLIGFVLLVKGADWFVDGSSSVAKLLKVPSVIIGLTIVAMGTSAPEAAVSITAGFTGNNEIAISNVLGSNIFNLMMVVGVCACIKAFQTDAMIMKRDFPISLGLTVLLGIWLMDGRISRIEGGILLILMLEYIILMVRSALKERKQEGAEPGAGDEKPPLPAWKSICFILLGLTSIILGGQLVVDNASQIAARFGLSETLIGLTIVAIGTSLPELVTSIVAAGKGESGLALGNVIGSNIFNIIFILGASAVLHPIATGVENMVDTIILLAVSVMIYVFGRTGKKVNRWEGLLSVLCYIGYTAYIIFR